MKPDWMNASEAETGLYVSKKTTNTVARMGGIWIVGKGDPILGPDDRVYGPIPDDDEDERSNQ